jgi:hypothetical protein
MLTFREHISPAQAAELLRKNRINRPLRLAWVAALAEMIERGEWILTHQGVAITTDNELVDGQHRLSAIVKCGIGVEMNVSYDCDPLSFQVIDGGIKRSAADHLRVPPMMTAIAKTLWKLSFPTTRKPPSAQQLSSVLAWSRPVVERSMEIGRTTTPRTAATVQTAIVCHLMAGRDEVLPKFSAFASLDRDNMPPSIWSLAKQLLDGAAGTRYDAWDVVCRAWRAFDPKNWEQQRLQLKGTEAPLSEMARVADAYQRAATSKTFRR